MFWPGSWPANIQRLTSAPIFSIASSNQIALPHDLCMARPCSSWSFSYPSTRLSGARPTSATDMNSCE
jgi:hypothetical protein